MQIVVMGVAGSGKTTVGRALAGALGFDFVDADDLHPPANVQAMASGRPLTDADRSPWLDAVRDRLADARAHGASTVLACSALARHHRDRLGLARADALVYLDATPELLRERLRARVGHFMKEGMLASQLAILEPPEGAITIDAALPLTDQLAAIRHALGR